MHKSNHKTKEFVLKKLLIKTIWQKKCSGSQVKFPFLEDKNVLSDDVITLNEAGKMTIGEKTCGKLPDILGSPENP